MRLSISSPVGMVGTAAHNAWLAHSQRLAASPGRRPHIQNALARQGDGAGRVWIKGEITDASALKTVAEIEAAPAGELQIYVDSVGGDVAGAEEIADAVKAHKGPTEGCCLRGHSAAMLPLLACNRVVIARDGELLIHAASSHVPGGLQRRDLGAVDAGLISTERQVADALAARSRSCPSSFFTYLMGCDKGNGTMLDAEQCLAYNLCDAISPWPMRHIRDKGRLP